VSTSRFLGVFLLSTALYAQLASHLDGNIPDEFHAPNPFAPHDYDDFGAAVMPLVPDWPSKPPAQPISGVVSVRELEHPIAKKAVRAAYKAQQFSKAHNTAKAIAQLEKAVNIDPSYRDAYCNLGVQYARIGRLADARAEFQKALEIGPPSALIYTNLAVSFDAMGEHRQAEIYARQALVLDPRNSASQRIVSSRGH
jgi:Tfp pilus assembly protein PilF